MIEVTNLRKILGGRTVLDDVSLRVPRGQSVVVMGDSGSGKTTFLRCLVGLEPADAGSVRVGDVQLDPGAADHDRVLLRLRRRVGFVFQQWNLFTNRNVLGNVVEAPIYVACLPRETALAKARALLERVGIGQRAAAYPHELSGGEQQRAAIARALAMEPEVLLLDEPTSSLDAGRADSLLALLRDLATGGLTLIVATHDARVPAALDARVVVLANGRLTPNPPP